MNKTKHLPSIPLTGWESRSKGDVSLENGTYQGAWDGKRCIIELDGITDYEFETESIHEGNVQYPVIVFVADKKAKLSIGYFTSSC